MSDPFTSDAFIAVFPEFASLPNVAAQVSGALNFMASDISAESFGSDYVKALMLLTAHWLILTGPQRSGGKGAVTSERVGDLSRSYQAANAMRTLDSTSYGQMFIRLARRKVGAIGFQGQSYPVNAGDFPPLP